jgi:hypothetical protein
LSLSASFILKAKLVAGLLKEADTYRVGPTVQAAWVGYSRHVGSYFPLSQAQDVMGESKDTLKGSCSQNTLKNKSLEHQSNRQERNFTDRDRHTETHMGVWKMGAPPTLELGNIYI